YSCPPLIAPLSLRRSSDLYLAWAEDWLAGLVAANRRAGRYREASLARAVARYWAGACVSAHRELGAKALARLFRSPLQRMAAPFGGWPALLPAPALRLDPAPPAACRRSASGFAAGSAGHGCGSPRSFASPPCAACA